ncbi:hypothetical protein KA001_01800, partial [Patescibacteria group bacterium]|nr:hypothetical protein [Patescibacteria group bacterium]
MPKIIEKYFTFKNTIIFLFLISFLLFCKPINLTTADLGRHIKNGEIFLQNFTVPTTNLYSYTNTNFPTLNHHLGFGIIVYLIYSCVDFIGLSVFFSLLASSIMCLLYFLLSKKYSFKTSFPVVLLGLIPFSYRTEIRPEIFSYLFFVLMLFIYYFVEKKEVSYKTFLLFLFLIQFFWVNIHIFFVFGILLSFLFSTELFIKNKKDFKMIFPIPITIIASFLNFNGVAGFLYPLNIFNNYAYKIVENQSVLFLIKWGMGFEYAFYFTFIIFTLVLSIFFLVREKRRVSGIDFILFFIFAIFSLRMVRILPLFGISFILFYSKILYENKNPIFKKLFLLLSLITFGIYFISQIGRIGIGLTPNVQDSSNFFITNKITGPIFNNYDIGGYLIFNLYGREKVFVDNRPEAYPNKFFVEEYAKMQEDESVWNKQ